MSPPPQKRSRPTTPLARTIEVLVNSSKRAKQRSRSRKRQRTTQVTDWTAPDATHSPEVTLNPASNTTGVTPRSSLPATNLPLKPFRPVNFAAYLEQPESWFTTLESDFAIEKITDERIKCRLARDGLSNHLPTLERIRDCFDLSGSSQPYQELKNRVLKRLSCSLDAQWSKFLGTHQLGTRKPTHFLADLRQLAPVSAPQ